ncbi:ABC transporter ATP-binding protein [Methanomicrobiaceae archaeon CYW5]|uniref:ABC transporter ATP-binding protein n=1 Tax=Methanovulcanius yangii TaxID=1789227 RepID=UPI0029C9C64D|nr:ABC transporter ATP-binding protein [Methanovulcanius yangii]MBT8508564.1 ABC transporter ATP-binding protein [Methanovulcanius yangii]
MEEAIGPAGPGNGAEPVIRLEGVTKVYSLPFGDVVALDEVSLSVMPGEFIAIMGPSGSGKSTLLNLIGSLDVPTHGRLFIDGRDTSGLSDDELTELRRDRIGFIFQQFNLIPLLNVFENVEYPMILKTRRSIKKSPKAHDLLLRIGLTESMLAHKPKELSGGQQQRVAIARALINDPAILLCDEPTGNLDTKTGELIMDLLKEVNASGKTVIMVTHDPDVATYASRTITIVDGRIV